jgi:hypothetical protein
MGMLHIISLDSSYTLFEPNLQIQYKSTFKCLLVVMQFVLIHNGLVVAYGFWLCMGPFVCISLLITNLSKILTGIMLPFCVVQMCSSIFQDYLN